MANFSFSKIVLTFTIALYQLPMAFALDEGSSLVRVSEKDRVKELLKAVSVEQRLEIMGEARMFKPKMTKLHQQGPEAIAQIDLLKDLADNCGANFKYTNDPANPNIEWPTVTCKFRQADKALGGSTNKFLCDFQETTKDGKQKVKTRKVKYKAFTGIKNSELVPTLLSGYLAKLVGLPSDLYCPAVVKCENCSSPIPYEFSKGRGKPSHSTYKFKDAMVEFETDLMTIAPNIPRKHARFPHGVNFDEVMMIANENQSTAREIAIEREAWMLWLNFIVEMDPHASNQRIACEKGSLVDGDKVFCEKPYIYTKDYGQSFFRRFQFEKWSQTAVVTQMPDGTCKGGMTFEIFKKERDAKDKQVFMEPTISREAKEFLQKRLMNISDKQWIDLLRIANTQRLYEVSPEAFLNGVKKKIEDMKAVQCAPFDSKTSIMSTAQVQN